MPQADFPSGAPAVDFEKESTFLTGARLALNIVKVNFFFFYLCQKFFHYMYVLSFLTFCHKIIGSVS